MEITDTIPLWQDDSFNFSVRLEYPVVGRIWRFRSEADYELYDRCYEVSIRLVKKVLTCFRYRPYLLAIGCPNEPSAFRRKRGILWDHGKLRTLPHLPLNIKCTNGYERLAALIDLQEYEFDTSEYFPLSIRESVLILSTKEMLELSSIASGWISTCAKDLFYFDFKEIGNSLRNDVNLGILRHYSPTPSRLEATVLVSHQRFVDIETCNCIDTISWQESLF